MQIFVMKFRLVPMLLLLSLGCFGQSREAQVRLIPYPNSIEPRHGYFHFGEGTPIACELDGDEGRALVSLAMASPLPVAPADNAGNGITLAIDGNPDAEAYTLSIEPKRIRISAGAGNGLFYGMQTLLQLLDIYGRDIPCMKIKDEPYLGYRGLHIDVSRHFFSKEYIMRQLDLMARYKINRFHWHLVDSDGWRIEIKSRPELTEKAAWRVCSSMFEWDHRGREFCTEDHPTAYGGYYTQEDIREVVEYAASRYITVIPEIEMPGHNEEVLCTYPQLSCSGIPHDSGDLCLGNPESFTFVTDVLEEVTGLFPGEYIHIGGDEAAMASWRKCDKCKGVMQREGLETFPELQSWFIRKVEDYLTSKGRKLIGWDEIMEGGLSPNATVMSWRDSHYGIEAARLGHNTIMCPIQYCYLNFYQDDPTAHTLSWPGYTPLSKVYSFVPVPEDIPAGVKTHILGIQANVWSEYINSEANDEMMLWPRGAAIAETGWTRPSRKDYGRFKDAALREVERMQSLGYHPFDLKNEIGDRAESLGLTDHLARGCKITYRGGGEPSDILVDGLQGGWSEDDGRWQGFHGKDMDVVIDLGEAWAIHSISATFLQDYIGWYFLPGEVEISVSLNNQDFTQLAKLQPKTGFTTLGTFAEPFAWEGEKVARYIRYTARIDRRNPRKGYLLTDEIIVK